MTRLRERSRSRTIPVPRFTVGAEAVKNVKAANQVTFNADQRVTDLFAKSGTNVDSASKSTTNVAKDADVTVGFKVRLPEVFTLTSDDYEAMHGA